MNVRHHAGIVGAALLVAGAALAAPSSASTTTFASGVISVPSLAGARYIGPKAGSDAVGIAVALPIEHRSALDALIARQQDPHSPDFHRWLTPDGVADAFGPSRSQYARAESSLAALGFRITKTFAHRQIVDAMAPAATVERAFHTHLGRFRYEGRERYANLSPAIVPASLAVLGARVIGLDDLPVAHHALGGPPKAVGLATGMHGQAGPDGGTGPNGLFTPQDKQLAYDWPTYYGNTGAEPVGIVMEADFLDGDVNAFLQAYAPSRNEPIARIPVDGGGTFSPANSLEVTLDVEQVGSMAPGAQVQVYEIPDLSAQHIVDAYSTLVSQNIVWVSSSSFGGCEINGAFTTAVDGLFASGVAQGQTFVASSGDQGSSCYEEPKSFVDVTFPASDPNVTAVGGTVLTTTKKGAIKSEVAWKGSGGGVSGVFGLPAWQRDAVNGIPSTAGRNVPDMSMQATNTYEIFNGGGYSVSGTSISSPDMASLLAATGVYLGRLGNANGTLYPIAFNDPMYHDIVKGCNGAFCSRAGYDDVTGIGSPDGENLVYYYYYFYN